MMIRSTTTITERKTQQTWKNWWKFLLHDNFLCTHSLVIILNWKEREREHFSLIDFSSDDEKRQRFRWKSALSTITREGTAERNKEKETFLVNLVDPIRKNNLAYHGSLRNNKRKKMSPRIHQVFNLLKLFHQSRSLLNAIDIKRMNGNKAENVTDKISEKYSSNMRKKIKLNGKQKITNIDTTTYLLSWKKMKNICFYIFNNFYFNIL